VIEDAHEPISSNTPREAASFVDYLSDEAAALPPLWAVPIEEAIKSIRNLFLASGGATYSAYFGSMTALPYIAVSVYQDPKAKHSKWWNGNSLSPFKLRAFIVSNNELLTDPRSSVGVWYDKEGNRTYLEITAALLFLNKADYMAAVRLGRRYNQIGIYDLEEKAYIALGGTGELPEDAPPVSERLPKLQRGRDL